MWLLREILDKLKGQLFILKILHEKMSVVVANNFTDLFDKLIDPYRIVLLMGKIEWDCEFSLMIRGVTIYKTSSRIGALPEALAAKQRH